MTKRFLTITFVALLLIAAFVFSSQIAEYKAAYDSYTAERQERYKQYTKEYEEWNQSMATILEKRMETHLKENETELKKYRSK